VIGRFISEDPIGFFGGANFYAYVGNEPLNYVDPYGLYWLTNAFDFYFGFWDRVTTIPFTDYSIIREIRDLLGDSIVDPGSDYYNAGEVAAAYLEIAVAMEIEVPKGFCRFGLGYVKRGSTEQYWRFAFGGKKQFIHGHIHQLNWYNPRKWIQKFGRWKSYD
jgi:hypothetical protein